MCHIVSLRRGSRRVATLEIICSSDQEGRHTFNVRQAKAVKNQPVDPDAMPAIQEFILKLNGGVIPVNPRAVNGSRRNVMPAVVEEQFEVNTFRSLMRARREETLDVYGPCFQISPGRGRLLDMIREHHH